MPRDPSGPISEHRTEYAPPNRIAPNTIFETENYENFTMEELAQRLFKLEALVADWDPRVDAMEQETRKQKREAKRIKKKLGMPVED